MSTSLNIMANGRMRGLIWFRKLRIAWSVFWGTMAVLLILLWVRSYWWDDVLGLPTAGTTLVNSVKGSVRIQRHRYQKVDPRGWWWDASAVDQLPKDFDVRPRWYYSSNSLNTWAGFPLWFPVFGFAASAAAAWIRRFSLRTLLIATTLVAVLIGLAVWAT